MSEIGTETPVRHGSRNGMAIHTSRGFEDTPAFFGSAIGRGRHSLSLDPLVKLGPRINGDAQEHLGVLHSAVLGALTEIKSCFMGINPRVVRAVWNQVGLPCKIWHPEAVVGICGKQSDEGG